MTHLKMRVPSREMALTTYQSIDRVSLISRRKAFTLNPQENSTMLVLSRKTNEKLFFPGISTFIQVIETHSGVVRLGITGPKSVVCIREGVSYSPQEEGRLLRTDEVTHNLSGKLNITSIGLGLLKKQILSGKPQEEIMATIERMVANLESQQENTEPEPQPQLQKQHHLLLVEDDKNQRELVAGLLRLHSYEVSATDNGNDALQQLMNNKNKPDVVLLDVGLGYGRMDGCEVARTIRKTSSLDKTKIMMVTGNATPAKVPSVDCWLKKPIKPERLLDEIKTLCVTV